MSLESRNARALGYDYPAGAEHDPRAPWNQSEPEECGECGGGMTDGGNVCCVCEGTGFALVQSSEEIAIEKADAEMDREKDEPRDL